MQKAKFVNVISAFHHASELTTLIRVLLLIVMIHRPQKLKVGLPPALYAQVCGAQVPSSGEETGRPNYIVAIDIRLYYATLKSDASSREMY
ncbi:hypothetical protein TNCV_1435271 [Trichonephila clavipes]|nr:hypothetical protein TNCV_1435271 [Trichonephila clavipes]